MTIATDSDLDVQADVRAELGWTPQVDAAGIGVAVYDGTITLSGEVDSYAERLAAKKAALRVRGVRAIVDDPADTRRRIAEALTRNAQIDADTVQVTVEDTRVTLTGRVRSWAERLQGAQTAWSSPHVTDVDNRIYIV